MLTAANWHTAVDFRDGAIFYREDRSVGLPPNIDLHHFIERDAVLASVVELSGAGRRMRRHLDAYSASRRRINLARKLSLRSHTFGSLPPCNELRGARTGMDQVQSLSEPEQASCSGLFLPQRTDAPHDSDSVQAEAISSSLPIAALDLILPNRPLREQWVFHLR